MNGKRLLLIAALLPLLVGCSLFGDEPAPGAFAGAEGEVDPDDPFAAGVLNVLSATAPPGSATQFLARLAAEFDWEEQVAQNTLLKQAALRDEMEETVEPFLLGLFYRNGFSVLPVVGEGHQFNRDSVVRGAVGSSRLLVTTRERVRIIFLRRVQNIQIVYHQDGVEPQVFSVDENAVVAVRQSLLKQYLR